MHFRGAAGEVATVEAVDLYRQVGAQIFDFPEDEGLGEQGVPEQQDGHVRQMGRQWGGILFRMGGGGSLGHDIS